MKKTHRTNQLTLSRQTLRALQHNQLRRIGGGGGQTMNRDCLDYKDTNACSASEAGCISLYGCGGGEGPVL